MPESMSSDAGYVVAKAMNDEFERDYESAMSPEEIVEKTGLERTEAQRAIEFLLAGKWVERTHQTSSGYCLTFTMFGKEQFDTQTGNTANEAIRSRLLAVLAEREELREGSLVDSLELEAILDLSCNAVMMNLSILEYHGRVEMRLYSGAGRPACNVSITASGKALHDNPPSAHLFISHAAVDRTIAYALREAIESAFDRITVFVSSAPDSLMAGDPWVDKILGALNRASFGIILTTVRGLKRHWVWFEAGAVWGKECTLVPCCAGSQRKGELPAPFSNFQAVNLEDKDDLAALFARLQTKFHPTTNIPDYEALASSIRAMDLECQRCFELQTDPLAAERRKSLEVRYAKLHPVHKEAVRLTLLNGEVTDHFVLAHLRESGVLQSPMNNILPGLASQSGFIQAVPGTIGAKNDYERRFRIDPGIERLLTEIVFPK